MKKIRKIRILDLCFYTSTVPADWDLSQFCLLHSLHVICAIVLDEWLLTPPRRLCFYPVSVCLSVCLSVC